MIYFSINMTLILGIVNKLLSHRIFQKLARLTYSLYLIHYTYQLLMISNRRGTVYFNVFEIVSNLLN